MPCLQYGGRRESQDWLTAAKNMDKGKLEVEKGGKEVRKRLGGGKASTSPTCVTSTRLLHEDPITEESHSITTAGTA